MRRVDIIIGVLILLVIASLLIPPIVKVRERTLSTQCQNNLRQIGFSLHDYHDIYKRLPAGTVLFDEKMPPQKRLSWLLEINPFVESTPLYKETNRTKGWEAPENRAVAQYTFLPFLCPANPARTTPAGEGLTHFVGIAGLGKDAALLLPTNRKAGIFRYQPDESRRDERAQWNLYLGIRIEDIKDGTKNTLMVVETNSNNGPWLAGGPATVRGLDPNGAPYLGEGGQFGSGHRHGSNAVFADASVRFLPKGLDPKIFEAMATIAGREEVEPFKD
jgi:hypothetical protein